MEITSSQTLYDCVRILFKERKNTFLCYKYHPRTVLITNHLLSSKHREKKRITKRVKMFGIGKNIIEGALNTTGDLAGSVLNAGSNIVDKVSSIGDKKIKGKVILMRSNVLDFTQLHSSVLDTFTEILGSGVTFQLISATQACNISSP